MTLMDDRRSPDFRPDIEGMRAIAIVGVILFHAGITSVPGGFLGVDLFFVLSGFLITGILVREAKRRGSIDLGNFWARRVRRLMPAASLVSVGTLWLSTQLDSPVTLQTHAKSAIAFATYWSNVLFLRRGADYFDQGLSSDPFLHTWTLGVEEQYYLLFAPLALLVVVAALRAGRDFSRWLLWILVGGSVASFVACLFLTKTHPLVSFYLLPPRAWEFGIGGILAVTANRAARERRSWDEAIAGASLATIVVTFLVVGERMPHPGWVTILPVLATAALIRTGGSGKTLVFRLLEGRLPRFFGRLSYSWYLWHWPVTVYWDRLPLVHVVPLALGMPVISLLLAWGTYLTVEVPARVAPWLQSTRRGIAMAGVLALLTTGLAGVAIRVGTRRLDDPDVAFILKDRDTKVGIVGNGCHLPIAEVEPKECVFGDTASRATVVLFGDSHAAQWFEVVDRVARSSGWRLVAMTKSGCPSVSLSVWMPNARRPYGECDRWRERALSVIDSLNPRIVVMANSNWYEVASDSTTAAVDVGRLSAAAMQRGLAGTWRRIPPTSHLVLLEDTPNPFADVPDCLFRNLGSRRRCDFRRDRAIAAGIVDVKRSMARDEPRVTYMDLTDRICDASMCAASRGDTLLYSDADHLTVRFTLSLAPAFDALLRGIRLDAATRP